MWLEKPDLNTVGSSGRNTALCWSLNMLVCISSSLATHLHLYIIGRMWNPWQAASAANNLVA